MHKYFLLLFFSTSILFNACAQTNSKKEKMIQEKNTAVAYFGAGCFWCTEAIFQRLNGVLSVVSGYGGGHVDNPTYEEVCSKKTGHAELIKITYDTTQISYDELLEVFWQTHDPTTLNQQGADIGPQYRSVIFYLNDAEKNKAAYYKKALDASGAFNNPIVTAIEPFKNFYPAENYHQNYYNLNSNQGYCRFVIQPKLEKFEKVFKHKLKKP
jgi:peptide-methionine (S)-S-oxide reductase